MPEGAFQHLRTSVIRAGLCTRCGSCVGACPHGALGFADELGECLPERSGPCGPCAGECSAGCPGAIVDLPGLSRSIHGPTVDHHLLGRYRSLGIAHATDERLRRAGSSGGLITATLTHLFDTRRIEGAYVLGMDHERPYRARPTLATTAEEALAAAQSKYSITPHNVLFRRIPPEGGPLAYVGLPCQVHALRKLQQAGHPVARRFRYVLGLYCGNILHFSAVRSFLARHGVRDLKEVARLEYRAGEWPGNMRAELRSGRVISVPKFHANYLIPFHIVHRCLLCVDLTNELADLSGGDAWAPEYERRGKGFSMLVVRTAAAQDLVEEMVARGKLAVEPVDDRAALEMHSHALDLKKRGAFLRIERRRRRGRPVPEYGYRCEEVVSLRRRCVERLMDLLFLVCSTTSARAAIDLIPDRLIAWAFTEARLRWKAMTRPPAPTVGLESSDATGDDGRP